MIVPLSLTAEAGLDPYIRIWNTAGQVMDFADGTFKLPGGATTPYLAMASANVVGTGQAFYHASVELDDINDTDSQVVVFWAICDNATPALADVPITETSQLVVIKGRLAQITDDFFTEGALDQLQQAASNTPFDANLKRRTTITRTA